jgi:5'(3')-deoxyribonucleotidase
MNQNLVSVNHLSEEQSMAKPTIAIDVDEVIFPLTATFFPYLKAEHGIEVTQDQMKTYRTEDVIGGTGEELLAKMSAYLHTEHYENAAPIIGAVGVLKELHKHYRLVIVTARHDSFQGLTERFLDTHFTGLFDKVLYARKAGHSAEHQVSKVELCKQEGAVVLIDDGLQCAEAGIKGVLFGNFRWNQSDTLPQGVVRCIDWPAVEEYFSA